MIVLPNTPPLPLNTALNDSSLATARASIITLNISNYNDCVKYATALEEYLHFIFQGVDSVQQFLQSSDKVLCEKTPWTEINIPEPWTVLLEVQTILVALAFISIRIGSELANELIDQETQLNETNVKWQQVTNEYKKSISYSLLGESISEESVGRVFPFLVKIAEISMQMSILSKFSWVNRTTLFSSNDISSNSNNGTLSRVAIYIVNELEVAVQLQKLLNDSFNTTHWENYFTMVSKYSTAYAGLFLAIENYQQNKIGHSIGLVNFSLLNLQSKHVKEPSKKPFRRLREKISKLKNESILKNLDSISTLQFNKSSFKDGTVVLNDLSYLFDVLIHLNLKFEKENTMLTFDKVVNWQDIKKDSKWPLGAKIPMSTVKVYDLFGNGVETRGGYY